MVEWFALGGVAIAVYLIDCCTWTGADTWACFRRPGNGRWTAARGDELPGNERGGVSLSDPLSLSGAIVQCVEPPFCVSPSGVIVLSATSDRGPEPDDLFLAFDQLADVYASLGDVYVKGAKVGRFNSHSAALHAAAHLRSLASLPLKRRAASIRSEVDRSMNPALVGRLWEQFQTAVARLKRACWIPLLWLFAIAPLVLVVAGPLASWRYLLAGLLASALPVAFAFVKLHRRFFPEERYERWVHAVSMVLFPIAAIRAADRLSKDLLSTFHPLAVVRVLCGDAATEINRAMWYDLNRACAPDGRGDTFAWYRDVVRAAASSMLAIAPEADRPPVPEDGSMASYCPRCHHQFAADAAECSDCESVVLASFQQAVPK